MNAVRTILFPSDLSAASAAAFEHARAIAERHRARIVIYHAVEVPTAEYARWGADHDAEFRARLEERARHELRARFDPAGQHEVVVDTTVSAPSLLADAAVLAQVEARRPDLVVMATHARTGLARAFIGSVTEQVVHSGAAPVLCVRPEGQVSRLPYRRLLVPTDLSAASRRAFAWAASLARAFGAGVAALHVPSPPTVAALAGAGRREEAPSELEVRAFLAEDLDDLPVEVRVAKPGPAWRQIVASAEERAADLVVMSSHGHDSLGDRVLGSTTDRVLRHCPVPVLVA